MILKITEDKITKREDVEEFLNNICIPSENIEMLRKALQNKKLFCHKNPLAGATECEFQH